MIARKTTNRKCLIPNEGGFRPAGPVAFNEPAIDLILTVSVNFGAVRPRQATKGPHPVSEPDRTLVANSKGDKVATELIAQGRRPSRSTGLRGRDRELRQILEPGHQITDDPVSARY